ncbi:MAG: hypothetical protein GY841_20825 [FCB group bacterium]|nr:hypothetical protein [FCB group bacterium]
MAQIRYILLFLSCLTWAGCGGDEECPSCPESAAPPPAWIDGEIKLYFGQTQLDLDIFQHGGAYLTIDSVKVGDSACPVDTGYWWNESDPHWDVEFDESGDDYMYHSGNRATVTVYGNGSSSTCRLVVLDERDDDLSWIAPDLGASFAPGEDITCVWHKLAPAEWYGIELKIRRTQEGGFYWENSYYFTFDTSYTLTAKMLGDSIDYFYVYVLPTTGPDPTSSSGNWTGDLAEGKLYSCGRYGYTRVYIRATGESKPFPISAPQEIISAPYDPHRAIQAIYKAYR